MLNIILIPHFGILAAAFTTFFSFFVLALLEIYYSAKEFLFDVDWIFTLKSVFASILMSLFIVWLKPAGFYNVISVVVLSILVYGILLVLLKCFNEKEVKFLKIIFKSIKTYNV